MTTTAVADARASDSLRAFAIDAVAARLREPAAHVPAEILTLLARLGARDQRDDWRRDLADYLERPTAFDEPLVRLARALPLSTIEILAVALCAAVEEEAAVGRVIAYIQAPLAGSRPTLGLIASLFGDAGAEGRLVTTTLVGGPAIESGLLQLSGDAAPLPERALSVPHHLVLALAGRDAARPGMTIGLDDASTIELPPSLHREAKRHAFVLDTESPLTLVVRTASKIEGRAVAAAIAATFGHRPLFIDGDKAAGLAPWAMLRRLLPVFCLELGPAERKVIPSIPCYGGPTLALCGPDGIVEGGAVPALSWRVAVPGCVEREALWRDAIGDDDLARELAHDHRHGLGRIVHVGRLARHHASLARRTRPTRDDVWEASWSAEASGLDGLAQPLKASVPDDAFVASPLLRERLEMLLQRCRGRDRLVDRLGPSATARYHPGVRALFVGPSGTGKSLAAAWLATRLGLPIYRVDLAAVTSKYIGETEKNLSQLLATAERSEIVLLFDEADSLFGARTDVREANDRFANAQTNYLLQRIETFDGICVLTSNSRARFDGAFSRRLDLVVDFAAPAPEERREIWRSHLGGHHSLEPRDFNQIAAVADVTGGEIYNAVLAAAVVARQAGRPISYADIVAGLSAEFRKLGRQVPFGLTRAD